MHFNGIFFTQEGIKYKPAKITKDLEFIIET
jgi:hypothetical protein